MRLLPREGGGSASLAIGVKEPLEASSLASCAVLLLGPPPAAAAECGCGRSPRAGPHGCAMQALQLP